MKIKRSLIRDDVIENKLIELQVKFLEEIIASSNTSTDFLIENNQEGYKNAEKPEEQQKYIQNVENLKKSQENRIKNSEYYKTQIEFLQNILAEKEEIEINTKIKDIVV